MTGQPASALQIGDIAVGGRVWVAPMTGVSDLPFRRVLAQQGARYMATEMVACAELARGRPDVVRRAAVGGGLPLTVIQLVGADPVMIAAGARAAERAGADLIDLNFGCPAKEVTGAACGSALMRDPDAALRIVDAAVGATSRPVTLKMRLGWDDATRNAPALARRAQDAGVRALTVHGRTRQQFYAGRADWAAVGEVKAVVGVPVIVNGDIVDANSARAALAASGADGVMLGRGVYGRPWAAAAIEAALAGEGEAADPDAETRLAIVLDHMAQALAFYGPGGKVGAPLGLRVFRKHLGWYIEHASWPADPAERRAAKSTLCRLDDPAAVARDLSALWRGGSARLAA